MIQSAGIHVMAVGCQVGLHGSMDHMTSYPQLHQPPFCQTLWALCKVVLCHLACQARAEWQDVQRAWVVTAVGW